MKKIALVAALAALSAGAYAQSSVTLWGRLNTTVESQKNGNASRVAVVQNNSSRLGFKGQEDLGGGMKASFALEHGFNSDNGAATNAAFWNREASVQLSGAFGAVRLGRWTPGSYFATADYVGMHNHDTGTSSDALYSGAGFTQTNKVGYFTPSFGGLSMEIALHAGEGADKRSFDWSANYDQGPMHLGAGFSKQGGAKQFAARALFELGAFTVGGYVQREDVDGATFAGVKDEKRDIWRLAGMYTLGASSFHLDFGNTTKGGFQANKASQMTVAWNYNLSKRTKVYTFYSQIDTKNTINKAGDFSTIAAGVRHNF